MRPGDVVADRFEIERLVGSGGMGAVYRARDRESGESIALKLLHGSGVEDELRFAGEGSVLSELRHPGIVQHVAHGVTRAGEPYLAMEWIEGEDLAQRLWRASLRVEEIVTLGRRVAEALSAAHARGVVHRDIKPSNLLLPGGQIERVKVVDFGLARLVGSSKVVTRTGRVLGTLAYLAPEQARGDRDLDARVDVFALGCVLFECLTGRAPFEGKQAVMLLAKLVLEDAPRAAEVRPGVPEALDRMLVRMLSRDPAGRPEDGAQVAAELASLDIASLGLPAPASVPVPALSRREQRLVALVLTAPAADAAAEDRVRVAVEPFEARLERLDDGRLGAALAGPGAAVDQVAHAARCALAMRAVLPGVAMALCTGPAVLQGRLPRGALIERATALVRAASTSAGEAPILLDEVSAGLLDPRFEVVRSSLLCERETASESLRPLLDGEAPFLGRDRELVLLVSMLDDCILGSAAGAVLVTGQPGVGKSRLRVEMLRRFRRRGDKLALYCVEGAPLRAGVSFGGITELVRVIGDTSAIDVAPEAFPDLVVELSEVRPVVIVLEDLQWMDPPSIQLIDVTLRRARDRPLLVCGFGRPEMRDLVPRLWADRSVHEIRLGDLTPRAGERLIKAALGEEISEEEIERIAALAAGNPLCLEELIRAVAAGRGRELPETVAAIAFARLAALPPEDRRLLRAASVLGESCTAEGLRALLGESEEVIAARLVALLEREILQRQGEAYAFHQALLREGAYRMLTEGDRALGHRLVEGFRSSGARSTLA